MIIQKEQLPLLCESDEDTHFTCPRKHRLLYYRNSKSKIKGAAFIIKNWPNHISSLLAYWWIGFIMIAITIFVIYNSLSLIDVITSSRLPFAAAVSTTDDNFLGIDENSQLNVYMHILVQSYDEINDEFYLKYVKKFAKKFTGYKFYVIVMLKDASKSTESLNDESKNDIAIKTVLRTNKLTRSQYWNDISIQYILLSKYLDNSPIKDSWRKLPTYTLPFLIRCVSIWDKGGIAFDPIIITPLLENPKYLENLYNTLKKYRKSSTKMKPKKDEYKLQKKPKVNNIQDIIRILENDKMKMANIPQYNLSEAENREEQFLIDVNESKNDEHKKYKRGVIKKSSVSNKKEVPKTEDITTTNSDKIEYLEQSPKSFHDLSEPHKELNDTKDRSLQGSDDLFMHVSNIDYFPELTVDMKGNIIATSTPCHAFVGTVFSNIKHYTLNNYTMDKIISDELSIFCKGDIRSCKYIDVIS